MLSTTRMISFVVSEIVIFCYLQPMISEEIQSPMGIASVEFVDPREPVAVSALIIWVIYVIFLYLLNFYLMEVSYFKIFFPAVVIIIFLSTPRLYSYIYYILIKEFWVDIIRRNLVILVLQSPNTVPIKFCRSFQYWELVLLLLNMHLQSCQRQRRIIWVNHGFMFFFCPSWFDVLYTYWRAMTKWSLCWMFSSLVNIFTWGIFNKVYYPDHFVAALL